MSPQRGIVVLASLDPVRGHEQKGLRPCVVMSDPEVSRDQRFPMICVVPISGKPGEGSLYPRLEPGPSGLVRPSHALVDQIRSVDKKRIKRIYGQVSPLELASIEDGIRLFLGLDEQQG